MNQTAAPSRAFAPAWAWVLALAAALLAACSTPLPDKPARPASYDLGGGLIMTGAVGGLAHVTTVMTPPRLRTVIYYDT